LRPGCGIRRSRFEASSRHNLEPVCTFGDIKGAFQIVEDLDLTFAKDPALVGIGSAQAEAGDIEGALKTLKRIRKAKDAVRVEIAVALAHAKRWKEALQTADEIEAPAFEFKALLEIARLRVANGDDESGLALFQKAIDALKDKGKADSIDYYRLEDSDPERLYQVMKAEGEVGLAKNALEWINKQDSPFVKAMALTGLAEGLVTRQKTQEKPKEK
jgi:tetratricopeptide (TPR) repeat protein